MIHQPLGGAHGQATEIQIVAEHILKLKQKLTRIIAENCGRPVEEVAADCERDHWLEADEAVAYGLVDKVLSKR